MNRKNLLLVAVALLLVALGNWLTEQGVKQVAPRVTAEPEVHQDYYLKDFTITALDKKGQLQHHLQATQLSHFTADQQTTLQQPSMLVYNQNMVEWRIDAERGEINRQQDEVLLQGRVRLIQPGGESPLSLTTSALRIQPKQGRADSDQPVTLLQADNRIEAVGIEIDQKSQRLLLLSQVRGRYEILAR